MLTGEYHHGGGPGSARLHCTQWPASESLHHPRRVVEPSMPTGLQVGHCRSSPDSLGPGPLVTDPYESATVEVTPRPRTVPGL